MTEYITTDTELISVADAIRTKGGTSTALEWPTDFVDAIDAISGGGGGGGGTAYGITGGTDCVMRTKATEGNTVHCKTPSASPGKTGYTVTVTEVSSGTVVFSQSGVQNNVEFQFTMPSADVQITVSG